MGKVRQFVAMFSATVLIAITVGFVTAVPAQAEESVSVQSLAGRWFVREPSGSAIIEHTYDFVPQGDNIFSLKHRNARMIPNPGGSFNPIERWIVGTIDGSQIQGKYFTKTLPTQYDTCIDPGVSIPVTGNVSDNGERIVIILTENKWFNLLTCVQEKFDSSTMTFER